MKSVFLLAVPALSALAASAADIALLSVATDEAALELARSETMRPVSEAQPLPYGEDFILSLEGPAQKHALEENERVTAENGYRAALAVQRGRDARERRETEARHVWEQSDIGQAVLKVPAFFAEAAAANRGCSVLHADADGFVAAGPDARLVRLLFGVPRFNPQPEPLPNTSDEPIRVTLPVTFKAESPAGDTILLETFEQSATAANSDALLGPARGRFLARLVRAAVEETVRRAALAQPETCGTEQE